MVRALRRKGPEPSAVLQQTAGGTAGDQTQGKEKVEAKFIFLGLLPKPLALGTISEDCCCQSSLALSHPHPSLCASKDEGRLVSTVHEPGRQRGLVSVWVVHSLLLRRPRTPSSSQNGGRVLVVRGPQGSSASTGSAGM